MGLDMYLNGNDFVFSAPNSDQPQPTIVCSWVDLDIDKYAPRAQSVDFELAYWRKHPALHGYIVHEFGGGEDDCKPIELGLEQLGQLLDAIDQDQLLTDTTGFFFGQSPHSDEPEEAEWYQEQKKEDALLVGRAIDWLKDQPNGIWRSVSYRGSW